MAPADAGRTARSLSFGQTPARHLQRLRLCSNPAATTAEGTAQSKTGWATLNAFSCVPAASWHARRVPCFTRQLVNVNCSYAMPCAAVAPITAGTAWQHDVLLVDGTNLLHFARTSAQSLHFCGNDVQQATLAKQAYRPPKDAVIRAFRGWVESFLAATQARAVRTQCLLCVADCDGPCLTDYPYLHTNYHCLVAH
jgi:hypothetical protein